MSTNNKYTIEELETALNNAKAGIDVEKNQDIIIDSKNFYYVLLFAIEVSNANIEKLQQLILDSDDYQYAYLFATNVNKVDIEKLSEVVLKSESNCYIYWFANEVEGANIQKFIDVLKTRLPADDKYVVRLEEKLAKMKPAKTPEEAYNEAIKGINVKENEKIVLSKKDPRLSYNFAKGVPTADIAAHEKIILDKEDYYFSFEFARTIPGANIQAHIHLMNKDARCVWEAELKEKLKEINDKKFLEEQDKEFLLSLKDDEETLKILEVVRMLEEEEKEAIKEIIFEGNAKFMEDLKKESIEEQAEEDKKETLQYIDYWIKEIKPNDLYAIEILKNIIENKFYDRIDILKQYHPDVININFLKKKINGNYPDDYKRFLEEAITYLSSVEKPKPIKETNWLKENAIEGIYQGISQTVVKNLSKSIVELIKLNKVDEPSIYLAEKFLSSPIGISILLALVGAGIHFIPAKLTQDNIHIQKVGDKCIQSCTAIGSEHLINLAMNFVLPAITNAVSSNKQISVMEMLEAKTKTRVNIEEDSDLDLYEKLAMIAAKK